MPLNTGDPNPADTPVGNGSLRLAKLMQTAEMERDDRLAPVFDAFNDSVNVGTEEEIGAAAGEVVAQVTIANAAYDRRVQRAVQHLSMAGPE